LTLARGSISVFAYATRLLVVHPAVTAMWDKAFVALA
jgi:hypothetical protein